MIAIIPARGGSKGIPDKNLSLLGGKPLIQWTIEAAQNSKYISRIIVSTDSERIAKTSVELGAEVPFMRPNWLSCDHSKLIDAFDYTLDRMRIDSGFVICLQPTSPFRSALDIDSAWEELECKDADSLASVVEAVNPVVLRTIKKGELEQYIPGETEINRQGFKPVYALNGAIWISNIKMFIEKESWYVGKTIPYIMPKERSLDIDTPYDLLIANLLVDNINREIMEE